MREEWSMKINLMFLLVDLLVLLAYPVLYVINKVRRVLGRRG